MEAGDAGPVPTSLVAVTVHVYVLPLVRPPTLIGEVAPVLPPAAPPSLDVHDAAYDVIGLPPSLGAVNDTDTSWLPRATLGCAGADGSVAGTTGSEASDGGPVPTALVAVTVHV